MNCILEFKNFKAWENKNVSMLQLTGTRASLWAVFHKWNTTTKMPFFTIATCYTHSALTPPRNTSFSPFSCCLVLTCAPVASGDQSATPLEWHRPLLQAAY